MLNTPCMKWALEGTFARSPVASFASIVQNMERPLRATLLLLALLSASGLSACEKRVVERTPEALAAQRRQLAPPTHDGALDGASLSAVPPLAKGVGHVTSIDNIARTMTIDHDPASGADWPEMRVTLPVKSAHLLEGVGLGDLVEFHVERRAGGPEIAALRIVKAARTGGAASQGVTPARR